MTAPADGTKLQTTINVPLLGCNYVFIQWLDYMGQLRTRCLPRSEFTALMRTDGSVRISYGNLGTLQNDRMTAVCKPVGSICVVPDMASLKPMVTEGRASVMAGFTNSERGPLSLCPRSSLSRMVDDFYKDYEVFFLVGFEIEVTFCRRSKAKPTLPENTFEPLDSVHAWATLSDEQYTTSLHYITECADALQKMGVALQQFHSEAGAGQYEFVLPPLPPVQAVDTLVQARQCIQHVAASHGLRATCHPLPFPGIGTAAHAHISFNRPDSAKGNGISLEKLQMSFMAAVLEHLPSLCAITMPQAESYGRVVDDSWTGGTWVGWGTENREVPLRKADVYRWEVRCLDGCANMYLALVAIMAAGAKGVKDKKEMALKDCTGKRESLRFRHAFKLLIHER